MVLNITWYRGSVAVGADGGGVSTYLFVNNNYCYTNHLLIPMSSLSSSFVASRHVVECSSFPAIRGQWINSREQTLLVTGSSTRPSIASTATLLYLFVSEYAPAMLSGDWFSFATPFMESSSYWTQSWWWQQHNNSSSKYILLLLCIGWWWWWWRVGCCLIIALVLIGDVLFCHRHLRIERV